MVTSSAWTALYNACSWELGVVDGGVPDDKAFMTMKLMSHLLYDIHHFNDYKPVNNKLSCIYSLQATYLMKV